MTNPIKQLKNSKSDFSLTKEEHASRRENLLLFMKEHPAATQPAVSPYFSLLKVSGYAFGAFLILGSGITLAASSTAAPGDALYSVRLRVTEPMQVALTLDTMSRTELQIELAQDRLKELATISKQEVIDTSSVPQIESSLEEHIEGAQDGVAKLAHGGHADDAYVANQELQSTLETQVDILDELLDENSEVHTNIALVTDSVEVEIAQSEAEDLVLLAKVGSLASEGTLEPSSEELRVSVVSSLDNLRNSLGRSESTLDDGDRAAASKLIVEIEAMIGHNADTLPEEKFADYAQASALIGELTALIEAERTLDVDVIEEGLSD